MNVRTRYAPAPSGRLHVGSAHTGLFSWLFARHHGGTFVLRIEDTDRERSRREFFDPICDILEWLGLDWDEGPRVGGPHAPYVSSERAALHREAAAKLEASGAVYRCWCTREDIKARGRETGYDRFCRTREAPGEGTYSLRLAVPDGEAVEFDDLILGPVRREYEELMDPVVVRSDGSPLYVLAVTADDIAMEITHVIRGVDLLDSTYVQILLYRALGAEVPPFAHLPLILGPDRSKLGKRHGSESLEEFYRDGILAEALLNYMALIGWSSPSLDEFLTRDRLIQEFTLERVSPSNAVFDHKKLRWMNQGYVMDRIPPDELERRALDLYPDLPADVLHRALGIEGFLTKRIETLAEIPDAIRYLHERVPIDDAAWAKVRDIAGAILTPAADALDAVDPWTVEAIDAVLSGVCEAAGLNRRKGLAPLYVAISGRSASLPIFDSIWIIGRAESVARLRDAASSL